MSAILISFEYRRRVEVNEVALSDNTFRAEMLLNPDGSHSLSREYGQMRMVLTGDSQLIKDMPLSEIEKWLAKAVADLASSPLALADDDSRS